MFQFFPHNKKQSSSSVPQPSRFLLARVCHCCFVLRIDYSVGNRVAKAMADGDVVASLQLQLVSLQNRVKELEVENATLVSQLSNCCCNEVQGDSGKKANNGVGISLEQNEHPKHRGEKPRKAKEIGNSLWNMHNHSKRYVALKVMYFVIHTWSKAYETSSQWSSATDRRQICPCCFKFYGFASEAQMEPTVESELFKAFEKTRLLVGSRKESRYSRCGRTDKGVSAVGQVIALYLRSKIKENGEKDALSSVKEIDYVRVLNRALPEDIRITGWCTVPEGFHARFSCMSREYKYFFWKENLDLSALERAGKKILGEHDFRNFCKMDAANVHNYKRFVTTFEICHAKSFQDQELWLIKIRGSAFLWHQVRCLIAVLFMIGRGLESVDVIDALLDIEKIPRKPQFIMAPEIPLVLSSCEFEAIEFSISPDARNALRTHFEKECKNRLMEAAIFQEALQNPSLVENGQRSHDEAAAKRNSSHIPLLKRVTEPSYEERRSKLNSGAYKSELLSDHPQGQEQRSEKVHDTTDVAFAEEIVSVGRVGFPLNWIQFPEKEVVNH